MFDRVKSQNPISEDSSHHPSTYYGLTKCMSRDLIRFHREKDGFRGSTAILFNHESRLRENSFLSRKVSEGVARIKLGLQKDIELHNSSSRVDWSDAQDFVQAMHLMLTSPKDPQDYVLASGKTHSVEALLEIAFSTVDLDWKRHTRFRDQGTSTSEPLIGNSARAKTILQWEAKRSFKTLITEMVKNDLKLQSEARG